MRERRSRLRRARTTGRGRRFDPLLVGECVRFNQGGPLSRRSFCTTKTNVLLGRRGCVTQDGFRRPGSQSIRLGVPLLEPTATCTFGSPRRELHSRDRPLSTSSKDSAAEHPVSTRPGQPQCPARADCLLRDGYASRLADMNGVSAARRGPRIAQDTTRPFRLWRRSPAPRARSHLGVDRRSPPTLPSRRPHH
jgi:hypothetical protein